MGSNYQNNKAPDQEDELAFVKTVISEHFDKIAECFNDDELKANYTKKDGEMNWMKLRGIFRKQLATDLKEEWNEMWEDEKLGEKLTKLRQIIKNTPETAQPAWRPEAGDIGSQCRSLDKIRLTSEKEQLKAILKEKEEKVAALKSKLTVKWDEFRELQDKVQDHQVNINNQANEMNSQFQQLYQLYSEQDPISDVSKINAITVSTENINVQT